MNTKRWIVILAVTMGTVNTFADIDIKQDPKYIELHDSMRHAFNSADSARFFPAVKTLEDYVLQQGDLHTYYTQRCNEIVFLMNTEKIFEAYMAAQQLSKELREKQLDSEMYMAINMMGHIQRYCGNKDSAKKSFTEVIRQMEKYGYYESMPPIYMNIVNVEMDDDPEEAIEMLNKAADIARQYSPDRVFDIECRRALSYYNLGDMDNFVKAYQYYLEGKAKGLSSISGRSLEIYYTAYRGDVDKAVEMAKETMGDESGEIIANLYKNAGRWQEAYDIQRLNMIANDSINSVILSNSMQGIEHELALYEVERKSAKTRTIALAATILLLILLILALVYIVLSRRRHMLQLKDAYKHALQSDNMKTIFIQNMSHEVRTPLNIIAGFAQVISDPDNTPPREERKHIAQMMLKSTRSITNQIDEMLELSINETSGAVEKEDDIKITPLLSELIKEFSDQVKDGVDLSLNNSLSDGFAMTTNRSLLRRMVYILLDNAAKNTTEGCIVLKASASTTALTIAVEDTGCGIAPEEAHHIFERFVKLDTFKEGLGLGLPLCRIIATRMEGSVKLDTAYKGPGARFVITLPIRS